MDWTFSPYVAAYFAFRDPESYPYDPCAIFRLNWVLVESASLQLLDKNKANRYEDCLVLLV